jgi:hypothetical protein
MPESYAVSLDQWRILDCGRECHGMYHSIAYPVDLGRLFQAFDVETRPAAKLGDCCARVTHMSMYGVVTRNKRVAVLLDLCPLRLCLYWPKVPCASPGLWASVTLENG